MASGMINGASKCSKNTDQLCRLCMSEDLLHDVHKEQNLHQWISDLLSIVITPEDHLSRVICGMCRMRIIEFHHFRVRCQDLQGILQAKIQSKDNKAVQSENAGIRENDPKERSEEVVGFEDMIVIEEVKIEVRDDDEEMAELSSPTKESTDGEGINATMIETESNATVNEEPVETMQQTVEKENESYKVTHGPKTHKCLICRVRFTMRKDLTKHLLTKQHLDAERDNTCKKFEGDAASITSTPLKTLLKRRSHKLQKQDCSSRSAKSKEAAQDAQRNSGNDKAPSPRENVCVKCDRSFSRKGCLKNHMRSHTEQVTGDLSIDLETIRLSRLNQLSIQLKNISTNAEENMKPLEKAENYDNQCEKCQKCFSSMNQLRNHMRKHQLRKYACKRCSFSFTRNDNLQRHMKTHEKDVFDRPNETESDNDTIDTIITRHSNETQSDRSCSSTSGKSEQVKQHIGRLQPFQCDICYKECKNMKNLRYHKRCVHGPKNHVCLTCGFRFSKRNNLKKHLLTKAHLDKLVYSSLRNKQSVTIIKDTVKPNFPQKPAAEDVPEQPVPSSDNDNAEYTCCVCNRSFKRQCLLTHHMRKHEESSSDTEGYE